MGYVAERCPGCGRSMDDYDQDWFYLDCDDEYLHAKNCPLLPNTMLMLFNLDSPEDTEYVYYKRLGLLSEYTRAEAALSELKQLDRDLWDKLTGWKRNDEQLNVYEALNRARNTTPR